MTNRADEQYLRIMRDLLDRGIYREGRNGGTYGLFGEQMRFDLSDGFPLLTTKKVHIGGMIDELLWFLSGSSKLGDLPERTKHWWSPWAPPSGDLGPIYGFQYRRARWWNLVEPILFDPPAVERKEGLFCGVGEIGPTANERGQSATVLALKAIWRDMIKRCYDEKSKAYPAYGGSGVHVCTEWLKFDNFAQDAEKLPGWELKLFFPDDYTIDKDILAASNRYGPDTCMWASHAEQSYNTGSATPFRATPPSGGEPIIFASLGEMVRHFGVNQSAVHRCLTGALHTHHGWSDFNYLKPGDAGKVFRFREYDQLKGVIASIRREPFGRRHVINLWAAGAMQHARLPCCHGSIIQFHVAEGKLSCATYQRSADWLIGVPINIASYALLTHLVAREVGLGVGTLYYNFGDLHLYANHVDQAREQLTRSPRALPVLSINPDFEKGIFDIEPGDIALVAYDPHPAIRAEVSA